MKIFIISTFISSCIFASCSSSSYDDRTTSKEIDHVFSINFDSLSKDVIFERTLLWLSNNFVDYKTGIDYKNQKIGLIIANGRTERSNKSINEKIEYPGRLVGGSNWTGLLYKLTINVDNDKTKFKFDNIIPYAFGDNNEQTTLLTKKPNLSNDKEIHKEAGEIFNKLVNEIKNFVISED